MAYERIYIPGWYEPCHDVDLDCGAATLEEAIIELARLIREKYDVPEIGPEQE